MATFLSSRQYWEKQGQELRQTKAQTSHFEISTTILIIQPLTRAVFIILILKFQEILGTCACRKLMSTDKWIGVLLLINH